ncbi:MAG: DEAD/DEAH box helicase family protein [bacterium]
MNDRYQKEYKYLNVNISKERKSFLKKVLLSSDLEESSEFSFWDLEMYDSRDNNRQKIKSIAFMSKLNHNIQLTTQQVEILSILNESSLFLSAPTSFGKTFIVLEFIKRNINNLNNILFVVPTIALMNELVKKIYDNFSDYYNISINKEEVFSERNIFIMVPERTNTEFITMLKEKKLDLLIIDEIYKLQSKRVATDDRIITMNKAYFDLVKTATKVILLGPFIKDISFNNTNLNITKFFTNYSPVYSELITYGSGWIDNLDVSKSQLIYFNKPQNIYNNIDIILRNIKINNELCILYKEEIDYLSNIGGENWYFVKLLKRGIGIHHGKTPNYFRKFLEDEYNVGNIKTLLCTSTLMEGVNTPTNSLIVVDDPDGAFEFSNLVGRVARLSPENPVVGEVYVSNEIFDKYNDVDQWKNLTILAEGDVANSEDELLYFDKTECEKKGKLEQYNKDIEYLNNNFNVTKEKIINKTLKFKTVVKFAKGDYKRQYKLAASVKHCNDLSIKLLLNISQDWKKEKFPSISSEDGYLQYKFYILKILNNVSLEVLVQKFKDDVPNYKQVDIDIFLDKINELEKIIKFKLIIIKDYLDLFIKPDEMTNDLKNYYNLLCGYTERSIECKILDDLGVETVDVPNIIKNLNMNSEKISTSNIISKIKSNKSKILSNVKSPFTIRNINKL